MFLGLSKALDLIRASSIFAAVLIFFGACGVGACGESRVAPHKATPPTEVASLQSPKVPSQRTKSREFFSKALGVTKKYYVILPEGYSEKVVYPSVYLLHGLGGNEKNWLNLGAAEASTENFDGVVIMPDGDDSFYSNRSTDLSYEDCLLQGSPFGESSRRDEYCVKKGDYENYIIQDLIADVEATYSVHRSRAGRGIGGLSMGGYGALMLSLRNPALFASVTSHSGVASILYSGPLPYQKGKETLSRDPRALSAKLGIIGSQMLAVWGPEQANWEAHDPPSLAKKMAKENSGELPALYLDCGTEDEFQLQHGASYFRDVLLSMGVVHDFHLMPGHHSAAFWRARLPAGLRFHSEHLLAKSPEMLD